MCAVCFGTLTVMKNYKRMISMILTAAVLIALAAFTASAQSYYVRGDANGDEKVEIVDVSLVQKVLADLEKDSEGSVKRNCDVNHNGLDIADATSIQFYLAQYDNPYRVGDRIVFDEYELPFIPV